MNLGVTVQAQKEALLRFIQKLLPGSVRAIPEIDGKGFGDGSEVVKSQRGIVAAVSAALAAAAFLLNQEQSSFAATSLL